MPIRTLTAPVSICFGITNRCNLNCRHCLAASTRRNDDLSTKELLRIIKEIGELKVLNLSISGGEPLLRNDFFILLDALSNFNIKITLNTNGTLITSPMAKRLASSRIKRFIVSLDGSNSDVHDSYRGKGSFIKAVNGIKFLLEKKCSVVISTTVTRKNFKDVGNIVSLGQKLGAGSVRFNDVTYVGNAACFNKELIMTPKEKFELLDNMIKLKAEFGEFVRGTLFEIIDIMQKMKTKPREQFPLKVTSCGAATLKCAIRPDGFVTPCEIIWDVKAGNLREKSLEDIWHHSEVLNAFRQPLEIKEEQIPECKGCKYLQLCYKGHRCQPYYNPGKQFKHKELYCWREDVCAAS
jgi:SynChlorMet cassette radical SAM/SPASM protein ScmE